MRIGAEFLSRLNITNLQCTSPMQSNHEPPDSTLIDANALRAQIFPGFSYENPGGFQGGCELLGIPLSHGRHLGNLGSLTHWGVADVD